MKSKIAAMLFALLFAVGFGAGGAFGIASLAGHLNGWWQARSWQSVSAVVLDTALREHRGDSTTYQVTAHYRYVVNGKTYDGDRVGFSTAADNIGAWQREHYRRLLAAKRGHQPIEVWVDRKNPEHSIIDRNIRWSMVAFSIPFATLFPLVSLGALWVMFRILRAPKEVAAAPQLQANATEIKSDARYGVIGLWFFATFWGLIAFPIAFLVISERLQQFSKPNSGGSWWWLLVLLFPLVGIGLIWAAATRTFRLLQHGEGIIVLKPIQPRLGDSLLVKANFSRASSDDDHGEYKIILLCEHVDKRGEDASYKTIWRQERTAIRSGKALHAEFLPPAHLPASEPETEMYHRWRIQLIFPDDQDERLFDIVVSAASQDSNGARPAINMQGMTEAVPARPIPETVAWVVDEFSKLRIDSNPANTRNGATAVALFGIVFAAVGSYLILGSAARGLVPILMGIIFAAIGVAIIGAGIYTFTHRRCVAIAGGQVSVTNRWLLKSKNEQFASIDVVKIVPRITGTAAVGSKRYHHHEIKALLRDGREIALASDIRDPGVALTFMQLFQSRLELADDAVVSIAYAGMDEPKQLRARPVDAAAAKRIVDRIKLAVKVIGVLLLLAFMWDFFN